MSEYDTIPQLSRNEATMKLLSEIEQNEADYLSEKVTRQEYLERAQFIDERLAVVGLRMAVRPWRESQR